MMALSRANSIALGWVAVMVLASSVIVAQVGHSSLRAARLSEAQARAALQHAGESQAQAAARQTLYRQQAAVVTHALDMGINPANWVEHRISLQQTNVPREKANQILLNTALRANQVFELQNFDISVLSPDEGLFDAPGVSTKGLLVHLEGTALSREMGGSR